MDLPENWKRRNGSQPDCEIERWSGNYSPLFLKIMLARGLNTDEDIRNFLNPSLSSLYDPFLLDNLDIAVDTLKKAIKDNTSIIVFGDYDADGIISSAMIYNFLKKLGADVDIYIPDRFEEGYGISLDFTRNIIKKNKYGLIICVDCGTNSFKVRDFLMENPENPPVIVCDHHNPSGTLEDYKKYDHDYIIINPRMPDCEYPFKELSGAGVTFKFIIGTLRSFDDKYKQLFEKNYLNSLLDLVAISTIADVMPLTGENRIIAKKGLKILANTSNRGLEELIRYALKDKENINEYDIGFIIAPRLNASGRIKNARDSLDLLMDDAKDHIGLVRELESFNLERQRIQKEIYEEIVSEYDLEDLAKKQKFFVACSKNWNEGVLGIVASEIVKNYNVPAILFREKGNMLKGSGRSTDIFDLYSNLYKIKEFFTSFGGHRRACGISMEKGKYDDFYRSIINISREKINDSDLLKQYFYDTEAGFNEINYRFIKEIEKLKPFGVGNPRPVVLSRDCRIEKLEFIKNGKHARIKLENSGITLGGIIFRVKKSQKQILAQKKNVSIIFSPEERCWRNLRTIQLNIVDLF